MIGESGFVCKASLRDFYLLTDKWIEQLGPPDKTVPNPHYRTSPPMQLWAVRRVEDFIAAHSEDSAFVTMQGRRRETIAKRETRRTERMEKREAELREWAETCEIVIHELPRDLRGALRRSHSQRDEGRFIGDGLTRRDALNFARHELSNYHQLLQELTEGQGYPEAEWAAYERMKDRMNAAALRALEAHCHFQALPD